MSTHELIFCCIIQVQFAPDVMYKYSYICPISNCVFSKQYPVEFEQKQIRVKFCNLKPAMLVLFLSHYWLHMRLMDK